MTTFACIQSIRNFRIVEVLFATRIVETPPRRGRDLSGQAVRSRSLVAASCASGGTSAEASQNFTGPPGARRPELRIVDAPPSARGGFVARSAWSGPARPGRTSPSRTSCASLRSSAPSSPISAGSSRETGRPGSATRTGQPLLRPSINALKLFFASVMLAFFIRLKSLDCSAPSMRASAAATRRRVAGSSSRPSKRPAGDSVSHPPHSGCAIPTSSDQLTRGRRQEHTPFLPQGEGVAEGDG